MINFSNLSDVASAIEPVIAVMANDINSNPSKGFLSLKNRREKKRRFTETFVNNSNFMVPDYKFVYFSNTTRADRAARLKALNAPLICVRNEEIAPRIKLYDMQLHPLPEAQFESVLPAAPKTLPGLNWEWAMEITGYGEYDQVEKKWKNTPDSDIAKSLDEINTENFVILFAMDEDCRVRYSAIVNVGKLCYWWVHDSGSKGLKAHIFGNPQWKKLFEDNRTDIIWPVYNRTALLNDVQNWK